MKYVLVQAAESMEHPVQGPQREILEGWHFTGRERNWIIAGLCGLLLFGANLEKRTALRHEPMTDLGVFACASWAIWDGKDVYSATDWHGWHYQYPPALAILFRPLAHPPPEPRPTLPEGVRPTAANTPWGYGVQGKKFYGLHKDNLRFFFLVAIWYAASVAFAFIATHALASVLEQRQLEDGPPGERYLRRRWWALRLLPFIACAGSIGTDWSRGQVDVLMLVAIALGLYFASARRDTIAGACLALPACVKLFPVLILLHSLWRWHWRLAVGACAGLVLFLVLLPAATLGPRNTVELYRTWSNVLVKPALGHGEDKSRSKELTALNNTDNQSLLAAIHNWTYHNIPRRQRPPEASPLARRATYLVGILLLAGVAAASRIRRADSPRELLLASGLLLGVSLVVAPIAHNYYYLLMLPLISALVDCGLPWKSGTGFEAKALSAVAVFAATDLVVRLPVIGNSLRDLGVPLLSLFYLLGTGAFILSKGTAKPGHTVQLAKMNL